MGEPALTRDLARRWGLAALADEAGFDLLLDTVITAIADRFTLKAHQNLVARRMAYIAWIERLSADNLPAMDYRAFVTICASLIASLSRHRVASFSAMIRDPHSRMIGIVLRYPNEVVALATGASLYQMRIGELTGEDMTTGLPAIVVENAAANLARHSEAASRFRELLQLHTPWV